MKKYWFMRPTYIKPSVKCIYDHIIFNGKKEESAVKNNIIINNSTGITITGNTIQCNNCSHKNFDALTCEECGKNLISIIIKE